MYCLFHVHLSQRWPNHSWESHNQQSFPFDPVDKSSHLESLFLGDSSWLPTVNCNSCRLDQPPLISQFSYQYKVFSPWCNELNETFDLLILFSCNIHLTQQRGWEMWQSSPPCPKTYTGWCRAGTEAWVCHRWWLTVWQHLLHSYRKKQKQLYTLSLYS